ncbi:MAG: hypothetical protein IAF94_07285 [Pirellulaceae bacterium]|nr:hypothetical protein [Pirellulaceae bacterium]
MGEENRGSSGSSTVMIVVAILGGILLLGCCGGVVVVGAGAFWVQTEVRDAQMELQDQMRVPEAVPAIEAAMDPIKEMPAEPAEPAAPAEPGGEGVDSPTK